MLVVSWWGSGECNYFFHELVPLCGGVYLGLGCFDFGRRGVFCIAYGDAGIDVSFYIPCLQSFYELNKNPS